MSKKQNEILRDDVLDVELYDVFTECTRCFEGKEYRYIRIFNTEYANVCDTIDRDHTFAICHSCGIGMGGYSVDNIFQHRNGKDVTVVLFKGKGEEREEEENMEKQERKFEKVCACETKCSHCKCGEVTGERIDIYTDGVKVTEAALLNEDGNVVAKGVSQLHPKDKFDFFVGAELALKKLKDIAGIKHIYYKGKDYGICGTETQMGITEEDLLCIGDQVAVVNANDNTVFRAVVGKGNVLISNGFVCIPEKGFHLAYVFNEGKDVERDSVFEGVQYL